jgi:hypothetical protein
MPTYYFIYLIIALGSLIFLIRYFILRTKSAAMLFFVDATKAENERRYLEAVNAYENALCEANKRKFHRHLKIVIVEKLKVLQTVRTYENNLSFIRKENT